jgi:hypothetical protein
MTRFHTGFFTMDLVSAPRLVRGAGMVFAKVPREYPHLNSDPPPPRPGPPFPGSNNNDLWQTGEIMVEASSHDAALFHFGPRSWA